MPPASNRPGSPSKAKPATPKGARPATPKSGGTPKGTPGTPKGAKPSAAPLAATEPAPEAPAPAAAAAKPAAPPANAREAALRGVTWDGLPGSGYEEEAIKLLTAQFDTLAEVFAYYSKSSPVADPTSPDFTLRFAGATSHAFDAHVRHALRQAVSTAVMRPLADVYLNSVMPGGTVPRNDSTFVLTFV